MGASLARSMLVSMRDTSARTGQRGRAERVREVVDDCLCRRLAGEHLSDEQVVAAHSDLTPELSDELRKLALIELAAQRATAPSPADACEANPERVAEHFDSLRVSIPAYKLVRELHRGGQGVVYLALQLSTGRQVAIKMLREGPLIGPADHTRFGQEVRILAQLSHPHIVTIHDSGRVPGGFYFVMDYIVGKPVDTYVTGAELPIAAVLQVFAKVCEAVHAAHLRGVIHRDLKPGNILVDENGEPRLLDFGLAKLFAREEAVVADSPSVTAAGQFLGSIPWCSPEQAESRPSRIDLRSDIYSLAVILYRVLTGAFPYEVAGSVSEVLSNIVNTEPARPSTHHRQIDEELETVILKGLSKDPERRYQSAGELARDIRHYLAGEPIDAKRDSGWYVVKKALRRHWAVVGILAAFIILMVAFAAAMSVLYGRAVANQRLAESRSEELAAARDAEQRASESAQLEAETAAQVSQFLVGLFKASEPGTQAPQEISARQLLDRGAQQVRTDLESQPQIQATLMDTIGQAYDQLGYFDKAKELMEASLQLRREQFGDRHPDVAASLHHLGLVAHEVGDLATAETLLREALAMRGELLGDEHPDTLENTADLAALLHHKGEHELAERLFERVVAVAPRVLGAGHEDVATYKCAYARYLSTTGRFSQAEQLLRDALDIRRNLWGENHLDVARTKVSLGWVFYRQEQYDEAERLFVEAMDLLRERLGEDHPSMSAYRNALAAIFSWKGHYEEAESIFVKSLAAHRRINPDDPDVVVDLMNLTAVRHKRGDPAGAEAGCREALEIHRRIMPQHPRIANMLRELATILMEQGRAEEAEPLLREAVGRCQTISSRELAYVSPPRVKSDLGACLIALGRHAEAETELLEALEGFERLPEDSLEGAVLAEKRESRERTVQRIVDLYETTGQQEEAERFRAMLAESVGASERP